MMEERIRIAKILAEAQIPREDKFFVLRGLRKAKPTFDRTLVFGFRGCGNAASRRMGFVNSRFWCSCDASPCQHEGIYLAESERGEEHRTRRGVKRLFQRSLSDAE